MISDSDLTHEVLSISINIYHMSTFSEEQLKVHQNL